MKNIHVTLNEEEYALLVKVAGSKQYATGKQYSPTKAAKEILLSHLNGNSPINVKPTEQDIEQSTKQPEAPKDRNNMDFSDLNLD